jgi:hypothetical protein
MAEQALKDQSEAGQAQSEDGGKKDRSSIQFPYLPLEEAITIAKGVHTFGGSSCQVDQLAAHLNQKPGAGSFRLKLVVAKMFGLTIHSQGKITLTPLGARICDSQREQAAMAESFLAIPLYQKVYEQFKGGTLPPPTGLETAVVNMGVAPKQKATARQVLHRSAKLAGFFWSGENRLVYPRITGSAGAAPCIDPTEDKTETDQDSGEPERKKGNGDGDDGGGAERHPFILGLIQELPKPHSSWAIEKRVKWLRMASNAFDVIYDEDTTGGRIEIKVQKDSAQ